MSIFGQYAGYYDLLYRDKDYAGEAQFIDSLLQKHAPGAQALLELGCGTGRHARLLAQQDYTVHGVDGSAEMLAVAQAQVQPEKLTFQAGDIRTVRVARSFDAAISLFHVVSYQTTNAGLLATFQTARAHLTTGGIFLFDFWYGPAVLSLGPSVRVKRLEDDHLRVVRIAQPTLHTDTCVVEVDYQVFIRDKATAAFEELHETHPMRYLFKPEVEFLLAQSGFDFDGWGAWMDPQVPGPQTWGVYVVARAR